MILLISFISLKDWTGLVANVKGNASVAALNVRGSTIAVSNFFVHTHTG